MMEPIYVICFYWEGDRWQNKSRAHRPSILEYEKHIKRVGYVGDNLPAMYINNLYYGVKRFASRDFKFVCFTNEKIELDPEIELRNFKMVTKTGVLPRLYMFSEEAGLFGHQVLCLDIDVVIVGSLKPLMDYDGLFCGRSKFREDGNRRLGGDIMSFQAGEKTEELFWKSFTGNIRKNVQLSQGRERYWLRRVASSFTDYWDLIEEGCIVSYKRHVRGKKQPPKNARIVSFHGAPRPHQVHDAWMQKYWKNGQG